MILLLIIFVGITGNSFDDSLLNSGSISDNGSSQQMTFQSNINSSSNEIFINSDLIINSSQSIEFSDSILLLINNSRILVYGSISIRNCNITSWDGKYYILNDNRGYINVYPGTGDVSLQNVSINNLGTNYHSALEIQRPGGRIENVQVSNTFFHAVTVRSITESLVLDGLNINNSFYGIYINQCANILLKNSQFNRNKWGIVIDDSENISVSKSIFTEQFSDGIQVQNSSKSNFSFNKFLNNVDNGIVFTNFSNFNIVNSNFGVNNSDTFDIKNSSNIIIMNNYSKNSQHSGVNVQYAENITLLSNYFLENYQGPGVYKGDYVINRNTYNISIINPNSTSRIIIYNNGSAKIESSQILLSKDFKWKLEENYYYIFYNSSRNKYLNATLIPFSSLNDYYNSFVNLTVKITFFFKENINFTFIFNFTDYFSFNIFISKFFQLFLKNNNEFIISAYLIKLI